MLCGGRGMKIINELHSLNVLIDNRDNGCGDEERGLNKRELGFVLIFLSKRDILLGLFIE